jgi:hypothetical protein
MRVVRHEGGVRRVPAGGRTWLSILGGVDVDGGIDVGGSGARRVDGIVRMDTGAGRGSGGGRYRRVVPVDGTQGTMGRDREQRDVPGSGTIRRDVSRRVK